MSSLLGRFRRCFFRESGNWCNVNMRLSYRKLQCLVKVVTLRIARAAVKRCIASFMFFCKFFCEKSMPNRTPSAQIDLLRQKSQKHHVRHVFFLSKIDFWRVFVVFPGRLGLPAASREHLRPNFLCQLNRARNQSDSRHGSRGLWRAEYRVKNRILVNFSCSPGSPDASCGVSGAFV